MRIIVTGGCGFLGSSLCLKLKQKYPKYSIVAFDNLKRRGSEINLIDLSSNHIEFIHGDIRNVEDLESIGDFDVLVDASAEPSVTSGLDNNPNFVINNNLYGSINCFNLCLKNNAKLVFVSTSRVYPIDEVNSISFYEEQTRFSIAELQNKIGVTKLGISEKLSLSGPRSFYGSTKLSAEILIQEYSEFYGIKASIIRFGVIAGPRQMGKIDQGVATLWMAKHYWKKELKYIGFNGSGKQVRDILHINDAIDLIDLQIHNIELFSNKIFNVGGGLSNSLSLLEMTMICEDITGNKIKINPEKENRSADMRIYISDNTKIQNEINWIPKHNVNTIFKDIFYWINSNESKLKKIL